MRIRPYEPSDWSRLCEIHDAARRDELAAAGLEAAFLPLEQAAQNEGLFEYTLVVAEAAGGVVGFVAFTEDELAWLYVEPGTYRQGVGKALISAALAQTKATMSAEVLSGNVAALTLYRKAGFEVVGTEHGRMPGNEAFRVLVTVLRHPGEA